MKRYKKKFEEASNVLSYYAKILKDEISEAKSQLDTIQKYSRTNFELIDVSEKEEIEIRKNGRQIIKFDDPSDTFAKRSYSLYNYKNEIYLVKSDPGYGYNVYKGK